MNEKDIVRFAKPNDDEKTAALMVVLEVRGDRILVSDLRFSEWVVPPTDVYDISDLEVVEQAAAVL